MSVRVVAVIGRGRIQVDFRRRVARARLHPAAEEHDADEQADRAELPVAVGHVAEAEHVHGRRPDHRPDRGGHRADQHEGGPAAGGEHRPGLAPIDGPEAPRCQNADEQNLEQQACKKSKFQLEEKRI